MKPNLFSVLVAVAFAHVTASAQPSALVQNFDMAGLFNVSDDGFFLGYTFVANQSAYVHALGAFQPNGSWTEFDPIDWTESPLNLAGNTSDAQIALYNGSGDLLAQADAVPSSCPFSYGAIDPIQLEAGSTYHLVMLTGNGVYFGYGPGASSILFNPAVSVTEMRASETSESVLPNTLPPNSNSWSLEYVFVDLLLSDNPVESDLTTQVFNAPENFPENNMALNLAGSTGISNVTDDGFFLGYSFNVNQNLVVTQVGAYQPQGTWILDEPNDPFDPFPTVEFVLGNETDAQIGLYNSEGALIGQGVVPPRSTCSPFAFDYVDIEPTMLIEGQTYHLILVTGDGVFFGYGPGASAIEFDPRFAITEMRSSNTNGTTTLPEVLPPSNNTWSLDYVFADLGFAIAGCTDITALNYDPSASFDDGSCILCERFVLINESCTWDYTLDYAAELVTEAGEVSPGVCQYFVCDTAYCSSDLDGDGAVATSDLLAFLADFGLSCTD